MPQSISRQHRPPGHDHGQAPPHWRETEAEDAPEQRVPERYEGIGGKIPPRIAKYELFSYLCAPKRSSGRGRPEGNDTTLFTIVCGLHETEYGYTSVNEMESVKVDGSKYGVDEIFQVEQLDGFKPVKLKSIPDEDLQAFLHNME